MTQAIPKNVPITPNLLSKVEGDQAHYKAFLITTIVSLVLGMLVTCVFATGLVTPANSPYSILAMVVGSGLSFVALSVLLFNLYYYCVQRRSENDLESPQIIVEEKKEPEPNIVNTHQDPPVIKKEIENEVVPKTIVEKKKEPKPNIVSAGPSAPTFNAPQDPPVLEKEIEKEVVLQTIVEEKVEEKKDDVPIVAQQSPLVIEEGKDLHTLFEENQDTADMYMHFLRNHLSFSDLLALRRVNRFNSQIIEAVRFGYEGNDYNEAKQYCKNFFLEIDYFKKFGLRYPNIKLPYPLCVLDKKKRFDLESRKAVAKLLIENGACLEVPLDRDGCRQNSKSPLRRARELGLDEIVDLLIAKGVKA